MPPVKLVQEQLRNLHPSKFPQGVFLSFLTDPLLPVNKNSTEDLIGLLVGEYKIPVAVLSKMGTSRFEGVRKGVTIISFDDKFWKEYEPNALSPSARRGSIENEEYPWVSVEPYPPPAIWEQNIFNFLEELKFAKLIVFGKWNYDARATTEHARLEYAANINVITDFCKSNHIRLHIKSDTLRFVKGE